MAGITVLCLTYVLSQLYRSFLAVLAPILTMELGMDASDLANASGAWFLAFAIAQFPVGYCLDTYGPRRTAGYMFTLFAGAGTMLFALASGPSTVILAMGLIGIGCAPVLMAPFFLFARNFSPRKFATYSSSFVALGSLGNVLGAEPIAAAATYFGWREVMWGLMAASITIGLVVISLVKDPKNPDRPSSDTEGNKGFIAVLKIRQLWPIFPVILMGYAVSGGVRGLWAGPYLEDIFGLDVLGIGRVTLFMAFALICGSLIYGPLDRVFNARKWVVFVGNDRDRKSVV